MPGIEPVEKKHESGATTAAVFAGLCLVLNLRNWIFPITLLSFTGTQYSIWTLPDDNWRKTNEANLILHDMPRMQANGNETITQEILQHWTG